MIRAAASLSVLLVCLALAACGFTPVHGSGGANDGPIHVAEIDGRTGHFLRQELVRAVGIGVPGVSGPAELSVTLTESIGRLGFAQDEAASRSDYNGTAVWRLNDAQGVLIASGTVRDSASFNFADAPYADITAQSAAQERVATQLARGIRDQMIIVAGKKKAPAPALTPIETP